MSDKYVRLLRIIWWCALFSRRGCVRIFGSFLLEVEVWRKLETWPWFGRFFVCSGSGVVELKEDYCFYFGIVAMGQSSFAVGTAARIFYKVN